MFPPRPPAPPKPPNVQNKKKKELLSSIEAIDLQIAQQEQQLETAQERKDLLQRSISTGTSVRDLTRKDSIGSTDNSSSSCPASSTNLKKKKNGGGDDDDGGDDDGGDDDEQKSNNSFVNDLIPTKLSMSEIVTKTLDDNKRRAFASRATLSKFVDDGTAMVSVLQ
jgi:hypothetical protein